MDLNLGLGRSTGERNVYPIQYFCLENSVDRGAWWSTVHGVAKSWTQLSNYHSLTPAGKFKMSFQKLSLNLAVVGKEVEVGG